MTTSPPRDCSVSRSTGPSPAPHPASATASWRALPAAQQPHWPDPAALTSATGELASLPPLVLGSECDELRGKLAAVAAGKAFLLHGGDCAETFDMVREDVLHGKVRTL